MSPTKLSCLGTSEATGIPNLLYDMPSFVFFVAIGPVLKYFKVPKYYDQDCACIVLTMYFICYYKPL